MFHIWWTHQLNYVAKLKWSPAIFLQTYLSCEFPNSAYWLARALRGGWVMTKIRRKVDENLMKIERKMRKNDVMLLCIFGRTLLTYVHCVQFARKLKTKYVCEYNRLGQNTDMLVKLPWQSVNSHNFDQVYGNDIANNFILYSTHML